MSIALTHRTTLVDRFVPKSLIADIVLVLAGTALTAVAAQLQVAIPGNPVPFTFQTLAVLLVGSVLGTVRGALSLALYAVLGTFLPIYTNHTSGVDHLFGATGGYIVSFVVASAVVGFLAEKGWSSQIFKMIASYVVGTAIIYGIGASWLTYQVLGGDWTKGLALGVTPFLIWDVVKAIIAGALVPAGWSLAKLLKK
ncbi:MAG: biotin transporter BioY [Micrococcales bacterium]